MQNTYPNWIDLKPSSCLAGFLLLAHGLAVLILMQLSLPWEVKVMGALLCTLSLVWTLRHHAFRLSSKAVVRIWQDSEGEWFLMDRQGQTHKGILRGDSYIGQHWVILNFKIERRMKPVVLFFDALARQEFHRFRVFLISMR